MRCDSCGREIEPPADRCLHCADKGQVRVLTPEERESFHGVTLGDEPKPGGDHTYESRGPHHRVYVRQVSFGNGKMSIWTKLALLAIAALMLLFMLPVFLFFLAAGIIWFILSMLRR